MANLNVGHHGFFISPHEESRRLALLFTFHQRFATGTCSAVAWRYLPAPEPLDDRRYAAQTSARRNKPRALARIPFRIVEDGVRTSRSRHE
jgi:hypothetical protein